MTAKPKRHRLCLEKLDELSLVDKPAQAPALVTLLKRAPDDDVVVFKATPGPRVEVMTPLEARAIHDVLNTPNGRQVVADFIAQHQKRAIGAQEDTMTTDADRIKDLEALLAKAQGASTSLLSLTPDEFAHARTLAGAERDTFIGKSATDRVSIVKAVTAEVYKAADGTVYRASDDPRLVSMAKRADEAIAKAADVELEKRAETVLKHLPGEVAVRKALLSAVECIPDEGVRKAALAILSAADASLSKSFEDIGGSGATKPETATAKAKLDAKVTKYASEKGVSRDVAFMKLTDGPERDPEACDLYNEIYS